MNKEQTQVNPMLKGRVLAISLLLVLPCLLIIARLYELQVKKNEHYTALVDRQQKRFIITPPVRGQIYSADGKVLAGNRAHYDLTIHPSQMKTGVNYIRTSNAILKIATDLEVNFLKRPNNIETMKKLRTRMRQDMAHPIVLFDASAPRAFHRSAHRARLSHAWHRHARPGHHGMETTPHPQQDNLLRDGNQRFKRS